jgi:AraC family transcriptional regulator
MHPLKFPTPLPSNPARQDLNTVKLPSLTLTESLHVPNLTIPPHIHRSASICLTLTGEAVEIFNNRRVVVHPGCAIMRAPEVRHSNQYGAFPHRGFMIELDSKWLNTCRHFSSVFDGHRVFAGGPVPAVALRIYHESRIKDSVAPVIVEGLVLEMLGHASRSLSNTAIRAPHWLTQVRDLLHGRFNDSLNLVEIANTAGVHPTHLARAFKKHFRSTVGEYVRRLRLDWAMRQLSESDDSIADIAAAAGFYDQSHFTHLFKQHTGFTPAEFRAAQGISFKANRIHDR